MYTKCKEYTHIGFFLGGGAGSWIKQSTYIGLVVVVRGSGNANSLLAALKD